MPMQPRPCSETVSSPIFVVPIVIPRHYPRPHPHDRRRGVRADGHVGPTLYNRFERRGVMSIVEGHGSLLAADAEALVNTVNTVGVMGKGIALEFRRTFPDNYRA